MDEQRRTISAWFFLTLTTSLTIAAQFRGDPDVEYHHDLKRGGNHARVTPGSYLVVHGIESFNDVLWYVPTEPFTVAPSTTTSSPPAAAEPLRNNLLFQQQEDSSRSRHRGGQGTMEPGSYEFGYGVRDSLTSSNFGHEESRRQDNAQGQYRVLLPDGRLQIVDYEADRRGFRPSVRYKDPPTRGKGNPMKTFRTY